MLIGKRKRQEGRSDPRSNSDDEDALRSRFQRAFEAKFNPLERSTSFPLGEEPDVNVEESNASEESDWSGISDDQVPVEVVDRDYYNLVQDFEKHERKAYMSSKPPSLADKALPISKPDTSNTEEDSVETSNLKHDLALQRLLKESHLLDSNTFSSKVSTPEGKGRLKALDLRVKDLGAKHSISEQEKMPLSHRRGIFAKATSREQKRRTNAAENGVVLEKFKSRSQPVKRREGGIGAPTVGKFKGGTLKLSSRDLKSIEGPKQKGARGGKGRR